MMAFPRPECQQKRPKIEAGGHVFNQRFQSTFAAFPEERFLDGFV